MMLKELLGFCGTKGCWCRTFVTITLKGKRKEGKRKVPTLAKRKLCLRHFNALMGQTIKPPLQCGR